jgi:GGDEF domain-containing protein
MFDVDGFKMFNDYLGHRSGDRLIVRFAKYSPEVE